MRRICLFEVSLLFLLIGVISCSDDGQIEPDFISAKTNDGHWSGIPEISINSVTDTLTLLGVSNEQVMMFKIEYREKGVYNLSGGQGSYYTTLGGDVITSSYTLSESPSSQITITEYNSEQCIIRGEFEITLLKKWSNPENDRNFISFTQGRFKGTITKQNN